MQWLHKRSHRPNLKTRTNQTGRSHHRKIEKKHVDQLAYRTSTNVRKWTKAQNALRIFQTILLVKPCATPHFARLLKTAPKTAANIGSCAFQCAKNRVHRTKFGSLCLHVWTFAEHTHTQCRFLSPFAFQCGILSQYHVVFRSVSPVWNPVATSLYHIRPPSPSVCQCGIFTSCVSRSSLSPQHDPAFISK